MCHPIALLLATLAFTSWGFAAEAPLRRYFYMSQPDGAKPEGAQARAS